MNKSFCITLALVALLAVTFVAAEEKVEPVGEGDPAEEPELDSEGVTFTPRLTRVV
jgi:hypothetical protein